MTLEVLSPAIAARRKPYRRSRPRIPLGEARAGARGRVVVGASLRTEDVALLDTLVTRLGRPHAAIVRLALDLLAIDLAAGARPPAPEVRRRGRNAPHLAQRTMAELRAGLPGFAVPVFTMGAADARQLLRLSCALDLDFTSVIRVALRWLGAPS